MNGESSLFPPHKPWASNRRSVRVAGLHVGTAIVGVIGEGDIIHAKAELQSTVHGLCGSENSLTAGVGGVGLPRFTIQDAGRVSLSQERKEVGGTCEWG